MLTQVIPPALYTDAIVILFELLMGAQTILGNHFVAMYLDGSLASGDFDRDSDIDFVVVTDVEISNDHFVALQDLHKRIAAIDSPFAAELEGTYISRTAIRRPDSTRSLHPNIERGEGQQLEWKQHAEDWWLIHLSILRERGVVLLGPAPHTLIDPVSPDALKRAMLKRLNGWAHEILTEPARIKSRGYQAYTVLSLCRILYTLEYGTVVSKPVAARWAQETLGARWVPLIERTWASRHTPGLQAAREDVNETLELIRYALERSRQHKLSTDV